MIDECSKEHHLSEIEIFCTMNVLLLLINLMHLAKQKYYFLSNKNKKTKLHLPQTFEWYCIYTFLLYIFKPISEKIFPSQSQCQEKINKQRLMAMRG